MHASFKDIQNATERGYFYEIYGKAKLHPDAHKLLQRSGIYLFS